MMKRLVILHIALAVLAMSTAVTGQDPQLKPLTDYIEEYKEKRKAVMRTFEEDDSGDFSEKIRRHEDETRKLMEEFRERRTKDYIAHYVIREVPHSCTKGYSGGTKKCGERCVEAPRDMITNELDSEIMSEDGTRSLGWTDIIRERGTRSCVYLQKSGKGRKAAKVVAKFRYSAAAMELNVERDTKNLFKWVR